MHPLRQLSRVLVLLAAAALIVAACGAGGRSTPSATTAGQSPSASPSATLLETSTPGTIVQPTSAPWPTGWDQHLCALFADAIVMQELAVDIGRALDENARADARALTAELAATATDVRQQLSALPPWEAAAPFERQMVNLLDLADEMAERYERYFETDRRNPLNAAREAGGEMGEVVPRVLERLDTLVQAGLACDGLEFNLETPPAP